LRRSVATLKSPVMVRSGPTSTKCQPTRDAPASPYPHKTGQAVTEQSTQVDDGNPLPEPPQLPPEPQPEPEPETFPRSYVEELR